MYENLEALIADYIASNYTFINSDGEHYNNDGHTKASYFLSDFFESKVDKWIKENYEIVED